MTLKRAFKLLVLTVLLLFLSMAGLVVYTILNPDFVFQEATTQYPIPEGQQLTEEFALSCAEQIIAESGLTGKLEPFESDRTNPADRYLIRNSPTSGEIWYGSHFFHIDLIDGIAHCELRRSK